jgi:hypothetical protein
MHAAKHRTLAQVMAEKIGDALVGGTITNAILSTDREEYGFQVRCRDGKTRVVWVMSDAEGNGTGFLEITEGQNQKED